MRRLLKIVGILAVPGIFAVTVQFALLPWLVRKTDRMDIVDFCPCPGGISNPQPALPARLGRTRPKLVNGAVYTGTGEDMLNIQWPHEAGILDCSHGG